MQKINDILNFIKGTKEKQSHICTYTVCPNSNQVLFFYVGAWPEGTQKGNAFIAFHGIPDGCRFPTNAELETALEKWLITNEAKPYDIAQIYCRMREDMEINKRLRQGETIQEIINSL
jgi:hypothetical protein